MSRIPQNTWSDPETVISCDATLVGCGGWHYSGQYFREVFPVEIQKLNLHISALELLTLVVTVKLWVHTFKNKRIQVFSDNMATVICVNTGKARDPFMSHCLRKLVYVLALHEAEIKVRHIDTKANTIPDLLSRWSNSPEVYSRWVKLTKGQKTRRKRIKRSHFIKFFNW